jgi:hypothetical protein
VYVGQTLTKSFYDEKTGKLMPFDGVVTERLADTDAEDW